MRYDRIPLFIENFMFKYYILKLQFLHILMHITIFWRVGGEMTYPKKNLNKTNKKPTNKVEPNHYRGQQLLKKKL